MKNIMIISLLTLLTFFAACSAREPQPQQGKEQAPAIKHKGVVSEIHNVQSRTERAPNFTWIDASGKQESFDGFHSNVTVMNFWATWCGPCRKEIPDLEEIHKEYGDKGVKVIGVSLDRGPSVLNMVSEFATNFKMTYPVVIDDGNLEQIFGNIRAIPTTFIINKEGKIVDRLIGMRSKQAFLASILPHTK
jgi:thiol-disulfide isomerase/thioredoxin